MANAASIECFCARGQGTSREHEGEESGCRRIHLHFDQVQERSLQGALQALRGQRIMDDDNDCGGHEEPG